MSTPNATFECHPLLFNLPVSLRGGDLAGLSLGAALWGRRHGLLSFEDLVSLCQSKQGTGDDGVDALARLNKEEYSEKGAQLVWKLEEKHICDTVESHQRYADEAIAAVYASVLAQRRSSPKVAERVICSIAAEIDCVCEQEWTGLPEAAPYLHDCGFSPAWVRKIFSARYTLQQADGFAMKLKFLFSPEKRREAMWQEIERLLLPAQAAL